MKMIRFGLLCFFICFLTGCWDKLEVEEQAFVITIGIDKGKTMHMMDVTIQVANPQVGSSNISKAEKEPANETITFFEVSDIISLRDLANAVIARKISYSHVKTIIIGESLARSDDLLYIMESMVRDRQIRRNVDIIICREKASEFIKNNKPKLETRPHKYYQFMLERWKDTGLVPVSTFHRALRRTEEDESLFLGIYATTKEYAKKEKGSEDAYKAGEIKKRGGDPTEIIGSAVLKKGKMIANLTGEETRQVLALRPKSLVEQLLVTYPDPLDKEFRIAAQVDISKEKKFKMDLQKDNSKIEVFVPIDVSILGIPSGINYVENLEKQNILKNGIENYLNRSVATLITKTQKEFKGEPFMWSLMARKEFRTIREWKEYDWMQQYPRVDIKVKFHVTLRNFGRQMGPINFRDIKD